MHIGDEMDIKEREAFEAWYEQHHNGRQIACDYVEEDNSYSVGYANAIWVGWQAAKASPEGFVLVRKELPEEIAESMALERVEKPVTETDPTWIKISEDAYKGRIQSKKWELWRDYKAMIEAQEQSHD